jgi:Flp pilus assembly protein TadD
MAARSLLLFPVMLVLLAIGLSAQTQSGNPETQIQGTVENSQGFPVSPAIVELHSWSGGLLGTATTDAGGEFRFNIRDPGPYELRTFASGSSKTVEVPSEPDLQQVVVRLPGAVDDSRPEQGAGDTVSVSDLAAPPAAKADLHSAERAMSARHLNRAWHLVNRAISAAPGWGKPYLLRGVLSMQNGDYRSARSDIGIALQRNPRSGLGLTEMGKLLATTGHSRLAALYLKRALAVPPVLWPTYFEMSVLDLRTGNYGGAAAMAQAAIYDSPPPPAVIHLVAAQADDKLHRNREADQEYRAFLALTSSAPRTAKAILLARARIAALETRMRVAAGAGR